VQDLTERTNLEYVPTEYDVFEQVLTTYAQISEQTAKAVSRFRNSKRQTPPSVLNASIHMDNWANNLGNADKESALLKRDDIITVTIERAEYYAREYYKDIGVIPDKVDEDEYQDTIVSCLWDYVRSFTIGIVAEDIAKDILTDMGNSVESLENHNEDEIRVMEDKGIDLIGEQNTYQVKYKKSWCGGNRQSLTKQADRLVIVNAKRQELAVFNP